MARVLKVLCGVSAVLFAVACGSPEPVKGEPTRVPISLVKQASASVSIQGSTAVAGIDHLEIYPRTLTAVIGQRVFITALAVDDTGKPTQARFQWRVANPAVGSISQSGLLSIGQTPGRYVDVVQVSTRVGSQLFQASATVEVFSQQANAVGKLQTLVVYPKQLIVQPGQTVGIGALAWDEAGRFIQNLTFVWAMSEPRAGAVDNVGFFTGGRIPGDYPDAITLVATQQTAEGPVQQRATVSVSVRAEHVETYALTSVVLVPGALVLTPGQQGFLTARAFDSSGHEVRDARLDWSADPNVGTLTRPGVFTAGNQLGSFPQAVTVRATQGAIVMSATTTVTVRAARTDQPLAIVELFPSAATLQLGQQFVFQVVGRDTDGAPVGAKVQWAVVDSRSGKFNAAGAFTAGLVPGVYERAIRVDLTQTVGQTVTTRSAFATISIPGALSRVEIRPDRAEVASGQSQAFRAVAFDAQGIEVPNIRTVWSLRDLAVGTIDQTGLFVAGKTAGSYENVINVSVSVTGSQR